MRERRPMRITEVEPDQSILVPAFGQPMFLGHEADGCDHACGRCGEHVLMENVAEGEVFDVAIRCPGCGAHNAAPARPRGYPLPMKRTAIATRGEHAGDTTYEITEGFAVAGERSREQFLEELGEPPSGQVVISDATHLDGLIEDLRALLGAAFERLEGSDRRAVASGAAHERYRHPHIAVRRGGNYRVVRSTSVEGGGSRPHDYHFSR